MLSEEFTLQVKIKHLDPFIEEKEEDIKRLKNIQLELHVDFIKVVETSRGSKLKDPGKIIFLQVSFGREKHL